MVVIKKMAYKILVLDSQDSKDYGKSMTVFAGSKKEEAVYAEFISNGEGKITFDTIELAVDVENMIKMRDFLNNLIEKIQRD